MTTLNSVIGPIDTTTLGFTLMHEHIIHASAGTPQNYPELMGTGFMDRIIEGLIEAKAAGISTVVDATTLDLGRDVSLLAEVSRCSGVNIIATSGMWTEPPRFITDFPPERLAEVFIRENRDGIAGTNVKAGILKGASDRQGVTPGDATILRAIACAHHQTHVPIMLHTYSPGQVARQQLAILKEEGVDLKRVKVDHSSESTDIEYLTWLLAQGCYLGWDRGINVSPMARARTLKTLIEAGYADRICPSHDWSNASMWWEAVPAMKKQMQERNPYGYLYTHKVTFPMLRELGVSEEVIDRLGIVGPRAFFEGV
ncbi:MAG: phosphotriesterase-related protein [Chloroflexi bacterium]|nr:phosphotriesterase-related protein [Chloroflexota bacterium]